jgi:GTPase Era involved in 16S rRNA processing
MMGLVADALASVDLVLLMVDATSNFGPVTASRSISIRQAGKPTFLFLNKIDLLRRQIAAAAAHYTVHQRM